MLSTQCINTSQSVRLACSSHISFPYSSLSRYRYIVAEAEKAGIESAGGTADIYQYDSNYLIEMTSFSFFFLGTRVPETLPQEVLTKMYAPEKPKYPIITPDVLTQYDAFLFGIPTRFGNMPAQWKVRSHTVS